MIGGTGTGGDHGGPFLQCRKGGPPVPSVRFFDVRGGGTPRAARKSRAPSPRLFQKKDTHLRITTRAVRAAWCSGRIQTLSVRILLPARTGALVRTTAARCPGQTGLRGADRLATAAPPIGRCPSPLAH